MFAFKTILFYVHGVEEELEWWPWSIDVSELVRIVDLAERFNLAGLKEKVIFHVRNVFLFPKERVLEIARVAEEHHVFADLSENLLKNCTQFLYATIEKPEDFNELVTEWSKKSPEGTSIALRLLARLDHKLMAYNIDASRQGQEVISHFQAIQGQGIISHFRNLQRAIQPRSRLQKIQTALENSYDQTRGHILDLVDDYEDIANAILHSFWICQKMDAGEAARKGITLKLDTLVEDHFTHEDSVNLHLDLLSLTTREDEKWDKRTIDTLWKEMVRAIPEVKPIILSWLVDNRNIFGKAASCNLAEKLGSCNDGGLQGLPEYANAIDAFPDAIGLT